MSGGRQQATKEYPTYHGQRVETLLDPGSLEHHAELVHFGVLLGRGVARVAGDLGGAGGGKVIVVVLGVGGELAVGNSSGSHDRGGWCGVGEGGRGGRGKRSGKDLRGVLAEAPRPEVGQRIRSQSGAASGGSGQSMPWRPPVCTLCDSEREVYSACPPLSSLPATVSHRRRTRKHQVSSGS